MSKNSVETPGSYSDGTNGECESNWKYPGPCCLTNCSRNFIRVLSNIDKYKQHEAKNYDIDPSKGKVFQGRTGCLDRWFLSVHNREHLYHNDDKEFHNLQLILHVL